MAQYNPNDFSPSTGMEINSSGNVVNPADGVDASGNQGVILNGRGTSYQRLLANQTIAANGIISTVLNVGMGTKAINAAFKCSGTAYIAIYPCDANGNPLSNGQAYVTSATAGATTNAVIMSEIGGVSYIGIYIYDKSAVTNTCQFVDVFWTKA